MLSPGSGFREKPQGHLLHGGKRSDWAGSAAANELEVGDVVVRSRQPAALCPARCRRLIPWRCCVWLQGLVLDVGAGTLAVYANGRRLGTMVQPGMTNEDGEPVAPLRPPLRWAVEVFGGGDEVSIDGPQPLPPG